MQLHLVSHLLQVFTLSQIFALLIVYYTATLLLYFAVGRFSKSSPVRRRTRTGNTLNP